MLGIKQPDNPLTVVMDYGGANVAKELHIGHLRSPIIGEALARLYRLFGHKVITDTHLGDYGLQMGLTIAQLEDDGFIDGYFDSSKQNKKITLDTLNEEYPKASKRKNVEPDFKKKAEDYTLHIQNGKEPYFSIYKDIRELSINKIRENYADLNCFFDLTPKIDITIDIIDVNVFYAIIQIRHNNRKLISVRTEGRFLFFTIINLELIPGYYLFKSTAFSLHISKPIKYVS